MFFGQIIQLKRVRRTSENAALTIPQGYQSNAAI